jgi:hypothetical protein
MLLACAAWVNRLRCTFDRLLAFIIILFFIEKIKTSPSLQYKTNWVMTVVLNLWIRMCFAIFIYLLLLLFVIKIWMVQNLFNVLRILLFILFKTDAVTRWKFRKSKFVVNLGVTVYFCVQYFADFLCWLVMENEKPEMRMDFICQVLD